MKEVAQWIGYATGVLVLIEAFRRFLRPIYGLFARVTALEASDKEIKRSIERIEARLADNAYLQQQQMHSLGRIEGQLAAMADDE